VNPAPPFSAWERGLATRYLRAKRSQGGVALISLISFLGIMIAVAVLISVMSIMNGFRTELLDKILGFNGHVYVVGAALDPTDREAMMRRIRAVPGVVQAAPVVEAQALVLGPSATAGAVVRGLDPRDLRSMKIITGNLTPRSAIAAFGQGEEGGDQVLVGQKLAETLGVQPGDAITIISPSGAATAFGASPTRKSYTVGGVFTVGMSEYDQAFIYMPLAQAQLLFGRDNSVDFVEIKIADPDKASELKSVFATAAGPNAVVSDWTEKNKAFFGALQVERTAMRIILSLIVIIAAMNIISGLVMLVKNKSRDIAILRTMGAGRGSVLRIFFMTGAIIGVAATIAGMTLGVLFCTFIVPIQRAVEAITSTPVFSADVYFLTHLPARIEWTEVGWVTLCALAASFLASLPQAWHASRLDPVEALRYE
jgi:lipoprotein-releasing system permease protein